MIRVTFKRPVLVGTHCYEINETAEIPAENARALLQSGAVCEATLATPEPVASRNVREVATKARKVETRG
jgi:hypothetical protein